MSVSLVIDALAHLMQMHEQAQAQAQAQAQLNSTQPKRLLRTDCENSSKKHNCSWQTRRLEQ